MSGRPGVRGLRGLSATDRNNPSGFGNAAFWGLVAISFLAGDRWATWATACWCWAWP
jgi:uncharacterized membrane protein